LIRALFVHFLLQFERLLLALHVWKDIPIALLWVPLSFWLLLSLVVTCFITWAAGCETPPAPGARSTSQRLRMSGCGDTASES
jgi:hypothetical protein